MTTEDDARRRELAAMAVELGAEVTRLTTAARTQAEAIDGLTLSTDKARRRTTIKIRVLVALFVADIALTAAIYVFYNKQAETSARLEAAIAQLQATNARLELMSGGVMCPMLGMFVGSYQPTTRAPGSDRDIYERNFAQMRGWYSVLHCPGQGVPPRVDLPPPAK